MSCGAHVPSPASSAWRMRLLMFRSGLSMIFEAQLYIEQWCGAAGAVDKWEWTIPSPGNTVERDVSFRQAGMLGWELTVKTLAPFFHSPHLLKAAGKTVLAGYCSVSLQLSPSLTRGTIVKARDKLYHPECFMCDDCGLNLKQRGYFFIEEQLYCETHAKERVKPPEGYDVVAVYPNAKVELV